jgi:pyruvate kinase
VTRRAKIIATIGPATETGEKVRALLDAGADAIRLNFSHGTYPGHVRRAALVREAAAAAGRPVALMQDLCGPKLRVGTTPLGQPLELTPGAAFVLTTRPAPAAPGEATVNDPRFPSFVQPGARILLDDGRIDALVERVEDGRVHTVVRSGGTLTPGKGINLPGQALPIAPLTEKDIADVKAGAEIGVDWIAMSFVRRADDLEALRSHLRHAYDGKRLPPVIAKLERPEALDNLDAILAAADGVMVARGDLGVEVEPERVPSLQKLIIRAANAAGKVVITATQMLDSMMDQPRPTRAEASDVANAIFDGADSLLLTGETAAGAFPIEAVATMARIVEDAEGHMSEWGIFPPGQAARVEDDARAATRAACELAMDRQVRAVAVFTRSGRTATLMAKARPAVEILAFTPDERVHREMCLLWGVTPLLVPTVDSVEEMITSVEAALHRAGKVRAGDQVVILASLPVSRMGPANFTYLHTVG